MLHHFRDAGVFLDQFSCWFRLREVSNRVGAEMEVLQRVLTLICPCIVTPRRTGGCSILFNSNVAWYSGIQPVLTGGVVGFAGKFCEPYRITSAEWLYQVERVIRGIGGRLPFAPCPSCMLQLLRPPSARTCSQKGSVCLHRRDYHFLCVLRAELRRWVRPLQTTLPDRVRLNPTFCLNTVEKVRLNPIFCMNPDCGEMAYRSFGCKGNS